MIGPSWARRARRARLALTALLAAALAFAGIAKAINPEDLGLLRLLGETKLDPPWISNVVAGVEIVTAIALLRFGRLGIVAAVVLSCGFVAYHVILGFGFGAPT